MADEIQNTNPSEEDLKWVKEILKKKNELQEIINKKNEIFDSSRYMTDAIEKFKKESKEAGDLAGAIKTFHTQAETNNSTVQNLSTTATQAKADLANANQELVNTGKKYAEINGKYDKWLAEIQTQLGDFNKAEKEKYDALFSKIEGLLPGGTTVGMATAFLERRKMYVTPKNRWLTGFVGSVLLIVIYGVFFHDDFLAAKSFEQLGMIFLQRIPFIGPLLWLAWFTAYHYGMSSKVEEDYAYKEVLSKVFEGYRKELKELKAEDPDELKIFTRIVLNNISESPGRFYGEKHNVPNPWNHFMDQGTEPTDPPTPSKTVK